MPAILGTLVALAIVLGAMPLLIHTPWTAILFVFLLGVASFATVAPLQLWVLDKAAGAGQNLASSLNIAAFNLGNALGAWVGGERPRMAEGSLENYADDRWNRVIDVNLGGVFATLRAAARRMKPQRSGRMIVTTSAAAVRCEPAIGVAYMAAKAGAAHLVRNVALEMAAFGITVNAIAPGMFVTNIGGGHLHDAGLQSELGKAIPAHRVGFPEDMYGLALFLASPASAYVTGQQILIDGGLSLGQAD